MCIISRIGATTGGFSSSSLKIEHTVLNRQQTECREDGVLWILREEHGPIFRPENEAMRLF